MKLFDKLDCQHSLFVPSEEQRNNLAKLEAYLRALPDNYEHFHMIDYFRATTEGENVEDWRLVRYINIDGEFRELEKPLWAVNIQENSFEQRIGKCGAVACAVGHGPLAGIAVGDDSDWDDYTWRVFGCTISTNPGDFMFSSAWAGINNTHIGAADRIAYLLQHGLPNVYKESFHQEVKESRQ